MNKKKIRYTVIIIACIAILTCGIGWCGSLWEKTYSQEDLRLAEDSVKKYATMCYALEGEYPESLEYLADNYALSLNKDDFVYHYQYIGANMMPEISVIPLE